MPDPSRRHLGKHSYSVVKGDRKVEVLLKSKAFYVRAPGEKGQVTWSVHDGVRNAWIAACTRAGILLYFFITCEKVIRKLLFGL